MSEAAAPAEGIPAPSPEATPAPTPSLAPEPAPAASWRDGLSDDLRAHPSLEKFSDVGALAKGYVSQAEFVGRKGVLLPKDGDAADQARFYSELGRPETADGYDLGDFAPAEGLPWSDNVQSAMLSAMHENGLTNAQVNAVVRAYEGAQGAEFGELQESVATATAQGDASLRKEFGKDYDSKVDLANRAFKLAAGDQMDEIRNLTMGDGTKLGDSAALVRLFSNIGESLSEDSLRGDGGSQRFTKSPSDAQSELSAMEIDEDFQKVLLDKNHPEHGRAVERRDTLYAMAYPEPETPATF